MTPAEIEDLLQRIGPPVAGESPAQRCARYILTIAYNRAGKLSEPQRLQLKAMGYIEA